MDAKECVEANTELWVWQACAAIEHGDFRTIADHWVERIADVVTGRASYMDSQQADLDVLTGQLAKVLATLSCTHQQEVA